MTKEDRIQKRDMEIDMMIDRFSMTSKTNLSREQIHKKICRAMILNNLAFTLADASNSFLMDCESELSKFGVLLEREDKFNFNQMLHHIKKARYWSGRCSLPIYKIPESDDACADSDWWYNLLLLIDDRLGDDSRKTNMFLEFLLQMPSEIGLFDVTYDDFKRFKKDDV